MEPETEPISLSYEDNRSIVQVHHQSHIAMSLADADLVNGDSTNILQRRIGETSSQVILLDLLNHIPSDTKQIGDILDCHTPSELQRVLGPVFGEATPSIGKADLDLPNGPAIAALHARQSGDDDGWLQTDR